MTTVVVPLCTRRGPRSQAHYCGDLCPEGRGKPCHPPSGSSWMPWSDGPAERYRRLREAIAGTGDGPASVTPTEVQERHLRWLAEQWDDDATDVVVSLFELAAERVRLELSRRSGEDAAEGRTR